MRVEGLGFRVQDSGFRVQGSGFWVQGSGFRVQGQGLRVWGLEFRVEGSGFTPPSGTAAPSPPSGAGGCVAAKGESSPGERVQREGPAQEGECRGEAEAG